MSNQISLKTEKEMCLFTMVVTALSRPQYYLLSDNSGFTVFIKNKTSILNNIKQVNIKTVWFWIWASSS